MKREEIRKRIWKKAEELRKIKIEELDVDIYYRPLTLEDEQRFKLDSDLMDETIKGLEIVYQKALDEDGNRIFENPVDKEFIRTQIGSTSLAKFIRAVTGLSFKEAKKN